MASRIDSERSGYKRLQVWQRAHELAGAAFDLATGLPAAHRWLGLQLARAALSVPANIAEGYSRGSLGDYLRFLDIAKGSLGEVEYHLYFLEGKQLASVEICWRLVKLQDDTARLLYGLRRALRAKSHKGNWDRDVAVRVEGPDYQYASLEGLDSG